MDIPKTYKIRFALCFIIVLYNFKIYKRFKRLKGNINRNYKLKKVATNTMAVVYVLFLCTSILIGSSIFLSSTQVSYTKNLDTSRTLGLGDKKSNKNNVKSQREKKIRKNIIYQHQITFYADKNYIKLLIPALILFLNFCFMNLKLFENYSRDVRNSGVYRTIFIISKYVTEIVSITSVLLVIMKILFPNCELYLLNQYKIVSLKLMVKIIFFISFFFIFYTVDKFK